MAVTEDLYNNDITAKEGSYVGKFGYDAGEGDASKYQIKSSTNRSYCHMWFQLVTFSDNGSYKTLLLKDSDDNDVACFRVFRSAGPTYSIEFQCYSGGSWQESLMTAENISLNTWYRLQYKYDINSLEWAASIAEGDAQPETTASGSLTANTRTPNQLHIGVIDGPSGGSEEVLHYEDKVVWRIDEWQEEPQTIKTITDSGAGTDALDQLLVALTLSDTASGADQSPAPAAAMSVGETGGGTDSIGALLAALSVADTGSGDDQVTGPTVSLTLTDDGSAVDAITKAILAVVTDSGVGTDASPSVSVDTISVTDTGTAIGNIGITVSVPVTDTASGADAAQALSEFFKTVTDTATGIETDPWGTTGIDEGTGGLAEGVGGLDAGFEEEANVIRVSVDTSIADSGSATDASPVTVTVSLTLSDSASAIDTATVLSEFAKRVTDVGAGSDGSPGVTVTLTLADTASTIEAITASAEALKRVTDAGIGAEDIGTITVTVPVTDSGTISDEGTTIAAALSVLETASAIESAIKSVLGESALITFTAKGRTMTFTAKNVTRTFTAKTGGN